MTRLMQVRGGSDASPLNVVQVNTWGEFARGDVVKIDGRPGHWRFCYYTSTATGEEWATVYGGSKDPYGAQQFVSVFPERLRVTKQPRTQEA
jgi:hypothetical protein